MRLTDLNPSWFAGSWVDANGAEQLSNGRHGMGIVFQCPIHKGECWIGVPFSNPIDGLPKAKEGSGVSRDKWWHRTGDTFETLTLKPSIDVKEGPQENAPSHWHGFITNGEVT